MSDQPLDGALGGVQRSWTDVGLRWWRPSRVHGTCRSSLVAVQVLLLRAAFRVVDEHEAGGIRLGLTLKPSLARLSRPGGPIRT